MNCVTIRNGMECPFMTSKGCSYNGGSCHKVVEKCQGCDRTVAYSTKWYCTACPEPSIKWRNGNCNLASHVTTPVYSKEPKLNPLKASKRKASGESAQQDVP